MGSSEYRVTTSCGMAPPRAARAAASPSARKGASTCAGPTSSSAPNETPSRETGLCRCASAGRSASGAGPPAEGASPMPMAGYCGAACKPCCVRMSAVRPMVSTNAKTRPFGAVGRSPPRLNLSCNPFWKPGVPGGKPARSHGATDRSTCQSVAARSGSSPKSGLPSSSRSSDRIVSRKGDSYPAVTQYGTRTYGTSAGGSSRSSEMRRPTRGSA
mmetsp:Transcript_12259/g.40264  ORF Transcript_12259/g.40264 Transcript_12259/m.40264 type:complete len:215 (+) Transcript_12259:331-975(+)